MSSQSYYFVGAVLTILLLLFGYVLSMRSDITEIKTEHEALKGLAKKVESMESRLDTTCGEMGVYFKMMDKYLAGIIHAPTHFERDELVEKMDAGTLTLPEASRLRVLLDEMMEEEEDTEMQLAGALAASRVEAIIWRKRRELNEK